MKALRYFDFRHTAPVVRRWTLTCTAVALGLGAVGVGYALLREYLGLPWHGWYKLIPLALVWMPIFVVAPIWYLRTRAVRRAIHRSGGRLCTHCAYDLSTLGPAGTCPECGRAYDVEKDAALWAELGYNRTSDQS